MVNSGRRLGGGEEEEEQFCRSWRKCVGARVRVYIRGQTGALPPLLSSAPTHTRIYAYRGVVVAAAVAAAASVDAGRGWNRSTAPFLSIPRHSIPRSLVLAPSLHSSFLFPILPHFPLCVLLSLPPPPPPLPARFFHSLYISRELTRSRCCSLCTPLLPLQLSQTPSSLPRVGSLLSRVLSALFEGERRERERAHTLHAG